jgi:alcohol dehydrogenase
MRMSYYEPLRGFEFQAPGRVIFGLGTVNQLGEEIKKMGGKQVLIITDQQIARTEILTTVKASIEKSGIRAGVYDKTETEPSLSSLERLISAIKKKRYDVFIGLGGGSAIDSTKAIAVLLENPGDPENYFAGGKEEFKNPGRPCITVPTTAGTGAEITWDAVIKDRKGVKAFFEHRYIRPVLAVVDPLLTIGMPPKLTASTGLDALSHAIESALTRLTNPITEALAHRAIGLISKNLRTAVYQGNNVEARYSMSLATLTAAYSETNAGDVEAHAIGHLIGSLYKIPHGIACGVVLPYVMEYNIVVSPDRLKKMAEAMGVDVFGLSEREAAFQAPWAVRNLIKDIGLPVSLKEVGIKKAELEGIAHKMLTVPWIKVFFDFFTVRSTTEEEALTLLKRCWEGSLGETLPNE